MGRSKLIGALAVAVCGATLGACNEPTYLAGHRRLETTMAMGGGWMADMDTFTIPIRRPTPDEAKALAADQARLKLPQEVPWVSIGDLPVEILFHVENLDATPAQVFFTFNGGDKYGSYNPGMFVNPNDVKAVPPPPMLGNSPIDLAAHEARDLVFREDDIAEAAIDLEAILRYPVMPAVSTPFKVLAARSDVWLPMLKNVPDGDVIPQVLIFHLQLAADAHVAVTYEVRVRDLAGKLAPVGATANLYL